MLVYLKDQFDNFEGIKVDKKTLRCLGVFVEHDKMKCYDKNWMKIITRY